jgi:hypothetical protein
LWGEGGCGARHPLVPPTAVGNGITGSGGSSRLVGKAQNFGVIGERIKKIVTGRLLHTG